MKELRFAILGTGFWARYQLAAWREVPGARCIALFNRTRAKAEALAQEFGVPAVYQEISLHSKFDELDFSKVRSWGCGGAPLPDICGFSAFGYC